MKKIVIKTFLFLLPVLLLSIPSSIWYTKYQGDLLRLGYLSRDDDYRRSFATEMLPVCYYDTLNNPGGRYQKHYTVLTIGDSFTERGRESYINYLAEDDSVSVLQINRMAHDDNPVETLYSLLNGDLFDKISFDYLVLQSVERVITERGQHPDKNGKLTISRIAEFQKSPAEKTNSFPPPEWLKFPLYSILYHFDDHAYFSDVYKVKLKNALFSGKMKDELLFHKDEMTKTLSNNNPDQVAKLNREFNCLADRLKKKNIRLIVLPSPDKYDLYYRYFNSSVKYPEPLFFNIMQKEKKNYLYIDAKSVLAEEIDKQVDIYYSDDTHWSPRAARIIAEEIKALIVNQKK